MELARVPEQVKTWESTREKQTSVVTDGNEESEKKLVRGLRGDGIGMGIRTGENLREHPRKANVGCNRREQKKAKRTSARFSAVKELERVPEQVKTWESTRVKRTSVLTDGNEESEKKKCAV